MVREPSLAPTQCQQSSWTGIFHSEEQMRSLLQGSQGAAAWTSGEHRGRRDLASGDRVAEAGEVGVAVRSPRARGGGESPDVQLPAPSLGFPAFSLWDPEQNARGAAFRVLAGPTRIRRRQQPGLGVCGRCRFRPSARGWQWTPRESGRVRCGGQGKPRSASKTISPQSPPSFPASTPASGLLGASPRGWAAAYDAAGGACSSRPRWGPCPAREPTWGAGQDVLPRRKNPGRKPRLPPFLIAWNGGRLYSRPVSSFQIFKVYLIE